MAFSLKVDGAGTCKNNISLERTQPSSEATNFRLAAAWEPLQVSRLVGQLYTSSSISSLKVLKRALQSTSKGKANKYVYAHVSNTCIMTCINRHLCCLGTHHVGCSGVFSSPIGCFVESEDRHNEKPRPHLVVVSGRLESLSKFDALIG